MTATPKSLLATLPQVIDARAWAEAHERRVYDLAAAVMESVLSKATD